MSEPRALPKYVQTAEMLIREIAAGRLTEGARLPPEREMAAALGLSVGTLRKALADLAARGLLERRQGSGNYIKSGAEAAGIYRMFRLELLDGGGLPTAEILALERRPKLAGAPDFGPAAEAHRIRRLRRIGGQPAALEEIWLDGARAGVLRAAEVSESLYLHYRDRLGFWIARVEDRVSAATAPDWAAAPFAPAPGAPCGHVERIAWDQDGARAEYSRTWFDSGIAAYVARQG